MPDPGYVRCMVPAWDRLLSIRWTSSNIAHPPRETTCQAPPSAAPDCSPSSPRSRSSSRPSPSAWWRRHLRTRPSRSRATPAWCRARRGPTRPGSAPARSGTSRSCRAQPGLHRRQLHLAREHRSAHTTTVNQAGLASLQPEHRADRHQLPADLRRRRRRPRSRPRPTAPSCSSPATSTPSTAWPGRRSPASTSPPARRSAPSPSPTAPTTRPPRWPPPTRRCTSAAGSAGSTASLATGLAAVERRLRRGRHRASTTTSPAASASTAQLGRAAAQAHPRREQAARRAHRPADRRPGPLRHGHHRHRHQAAAALAQPRCGTTTWPVVGGVTRIYGADIAPDDSYFVVTSGSGGDAPPISDTAVAFPLNAASLQTPTSSRCGSRGTSTASTRWPSPRWPSTSAVTSASSSRRPSDDPWPGLDNVGYGTGQGLAGYGLGDQVVRRDHIAALDPDRRQGAGVEPRARTPSRATRPWRPPRAACSSAATACSRAACAPDGSRSTTSTRCRSRRRRPTPRSPTPIEGRVVANNAPFDDHGHGAGRHRHASAGCRSRSRTATAASTSRTTAPLHHVRQHRQHAQRDARRHRTRPATWSAAGHHHRPTATCWSRRRRSPPPPAARATPPRRPRSSSRSASTTRRPTTTITGPSGILTSTTFTMTGTATDDKGVNSLSATGSATTRTATCRTTARRRHLQHVPRSRPDVVGATSDHLVVRGHPAARGRLARQRHARPTPPGRPTCAARRATGLVDSTAVAPTRDDQRSRRR